ncbi:MULTISPECIES: winged helix-turn-helix domain-containing protein [Acidiplasma]|jgi:DNA-binding transcriptional ArsR family regulator|uniref:ArsR family transcriptional regulator n=2 Tax=Acidiplasma TaxID=507753 RepID=A0A0N8VKP2_9ARCH|nr:MULTISPECIES: winged helix-turn-helix domain-containing protein [Acidiplasma]KJE48714.1 ArsR family transcriptional regulator [Acidiplasma sp. MBA-1]KPV46931.1 ArsR family transcriptional regulator [Acidiplasma aeolicum]KQB34276.1 ArsR family transcriptional regulator [Acidiplasma cupricumulans]KQB34744.1 ArsR family transcriptional regulator [Acidiplasma aeolicum]WMT55489.1 MAG: winged helix-turn-helix domain-containing protein [Acidiplasma sp.]
MDFSDEYRKILWWLLIATRGGEKRIEIIKILRKNPENLYKLSEDLNVNYRTAEHHVKVLLNNNIIKRMGNGYGSVYFLSDYYDKHFDIIEEIIKNYK